MAVLLLDRDPQLLDAVDGEGQTALHYAASCAHADLVTLLLDRGADRTLKDGDGLTPCNSDTEPHIKKLFDWWLFLNIKPPGVRLYSQKWWCVDFFSTESIAWRSYQLYRCDPICLDLLLYILECITEARNISKSKWIQLKIWPQKFQMMKDSGSIRLEMLDEASLTRQPEEVTLNFPITGKYFEPMQQIHSLRGWVFPLLTHLPLC